MPSPTQSLQVRNLSTSVAFCQSALQPPFTRITAANRASILTNATRNYRHIKRKPNLTKKVFSLQFSSVNVATFCFNFMYSARVMSTRLQASISLSEFSRKVFTRRVVRCCDCLYLAERVGFEPTVRCRITSFQDWLLKPLGYLSIIGY